MGKTALEYVNRLDEIEPEIVQLKDAFFRVYGEYFKLKAEYELVESKVFHEAPEGSTVKDREYFARKVAEETNSNLYTRLAEARAKKEAIAKRLESLELQQQNIQSKLKHTPGLNTVENEEGF